MIDTSSSIGSYRFQIVRELIENITIDLKLNSPETLFGLISYDNFARLEFNITRHTDLSTLLPAINPGLPYYRGYSTNTASALDFLLYGSVEDGFLQLRNETSKVAIVITDYFNYNYYYYYNYYDYYDYNSGSISSLQSAANLLHAANIYDVYAVGIGNYINYNELYLIASDPSFVITTSYFSSYTAQQLQEDVIEQLCSSKCLCHCFYDIYLRIYVHIHIAIYIRTCICT